MNPIRQLWRLIRSDNETPAIARSREVERESVVRQTKSSQLIAASGGKPGPIADYIWGMGKPRND